MESAIRLIEIVIWPITIFLAVLWLRSAVESALPSFLDHLTKKRNLRARFRGAEIELKLIDKLQSAITEVAEEPDPGKRLQIAKDALAMEDAIRTMDQRDVELLQRFNAESQPSFLYWPWDDDKKVMESYSTLHKLGLVSSMSMGGGEEVGQLTQAGRQVLEKLNADAKQ